MRPRRSPTRARTKFAPLGQYLNPLRSQKRYTSSRDCSTWLTYQRSCTSSAIAARSPAAAQTLRLYGGVAYCSGPITLFRSHECADPKRSKPVRLCERATHDQIRVRRDQRQARVAAEVMVRLVHEHHGVARNRRGDLCDVVVCDAHASRIVGARDEDQPRAFRDRVQRVLEWKFEIVLRHRVHDRSTARNDRDRVHLERWPDDDRLWHRAIGSTPLQRRHHGDDQPLVEAIGDDQLVLRHAQVARRVAIDVVVVRIEREVSRREARDCLEHLRRAAGGVLVQVETQSRRPSAAAGDRDRSFLPHCDGLRVSGQTLGQRERANRWSQSSPDRSGSRAEPKRHGRNRRR